MTGLSHLGVSSVISYFIAVLLPAVATPSAITAVSLGSSGISASNAGSATAMK